MLDTPLTPAEGAIDATQPGTFSRTHLNDIAALLVLPRMWRAREAPHIAGSLVEVLVSLLRLDAACLRLSFEVATEPVERCFEASPGAAAALEPLLAAPPGAPPAGGTWGGLRALRVPMHDDGVTGSVVVGSRREDFPTELEAFLCRVAVDQALVAVNTSRLVAGLTHANAAKATFLATMSHELRTPLNAIIGYGELLQAEVGGTLSDAQRHHVGRIESAARHLVQLIESILSFARLEAGREPVYPGPVDLAEVTRGAVELVEPLLASRPVALRVDGADGPVRVETDAAKVRQILLNLLSNAVKFTPAGEIRVTVQRDGDAGVVLAVHDTGVGIDATDLEHVFEPFRQVGEVHTRRAPGTGLGLSVSRQLARLLGGDVTAESVLGHGSTFRLRLPRTPPGTRDTAAAS